MNASVTTLIAGQLEASTGNMAIGVKSLESGLFLRNFPAPAKPEEVHPN